MRKASSLLCAAAILITASAALGSTASSYISTGVRDIFADTQGQLRAAYANFEAALADQSCTDCAASQELHLLYAFARAAMLGVRFDGGQVNSIEELAALYDILPLTTDGKIKFKFRRDIYDQYQIPSTAPDVNSAKAMMSATFIPEIDAIVSELGLITDPFVCYLDPADTGRLDRLKIDYGDVLTFKAILRAIRSQILAKDAYNLYIDKNERLIEQFYGNVFNVNDFLSRYPDFLKKLPTGTEQGDAKAAMAQARSDMLESVNNFLAAIAYIRNDPHIPGQVYEDLLFIDPNDYTRTDKITDALNKFKTSLTNDVAQSYTISTTKSYSLAMGGSSLGTMDIVYGPDMEPQSAVVLVDHCAGPTVRLVSSDVSIDTAFNMIDMDLTTETPGPIYSYSDDLLHAQSVMFTPSNCGANPDYQVQYLGSSLFANIGTAMNWHGNNAIWSYHLPFAFTFFGKTFSAQSTIYISSNGFIDFDGSDSELSTAQRNRIMPMGSTTSTNNYGSDVYIAQAAGEVIIRWETDSGANFAASLFNDGRIRFDYGTGNVDICPDVKISSPSAAIDLDGMQYFGGYFSGTISADGNTISNAQFQASNFSFSGMSASTYSVTSENRMFDPNPLFGSSTRYPNPVSPRDLLPQFNKYNRAIVGTVGRGIGNDATLGGILPDATQSDWQHQFHLENDVQQVTLQEVSPLQINYTNNLVGFWYDNQKVFSDAANNTQNDYNDVSGADLKDLYLGYSGDMLYGEITLNDDLDTTNGRATYEVDFSYIPNDDSTLYDVKVAITVNGTSIQSEVRSSFLDQYGNQSGQVNAIGASVSARTVSFNVPMSMLGYMPGKFIMLSADVSNPALMKADSDDHNTYVQFAGTGSITGNVQCSEFHGSPIFVTAYSDSFDPEYSVVASTTIRHPGPYQLGGIGLGWSGYVRAYTQLYGASLFTESIQIEASSPVTMSTSEIDGINLQLNPPALLSPNQWEYDILDAQVSSERWYSFDAVGGGVYNIELDSPDLYMSLYDRSGTGAISEYANQLSWQCPEKGRYFVQVSTWPSAMLAYLYGLNVGAQVPAYEGDLGGPSGPGVRDGAVNFYDLMIFMTQWLQTCDNKTWCNGADLDGDGRVMFPDWARFAKSWLQTGAAH
jgi:hypothetical protein